MYSEIGLAATYTRAMEEMYEDNVQYMELRTEITNVRKMSMVNDNHIWWSDLIAVRSACISLIMHRCEHLHPLLHTVISKSTYFCSTNMRMD